MLNDLSRRLSPFIKLHRVLILHTSCTRHSASSRPLFMVPPSQVTPPSIFPEIETSNRGPTCRVFKNHCRGLADFAKKAHLRTMTTTRSAMGAHLMIWLIRRTPFLVLLWRYLCFPANPADMSSVSSTNQCHPRASSPCEHRIKRLSSPMPQLSDCRTDPPRLIHSSSGPHVPPCATACTRSTCTFATHWHPRHRPHRCTYSPHYPVPPSSLRTHKLDSNILPPPEIPPPAHAHGLGGNGDYDGGESVVAPRVWCVDVARADELASVSVLVQDRWPTVSCRRHTIPIMSLAAAVWR